ncbi:MAG: ROK family protein [Candidatus Marinimicrobia bacterium]|nr:ROK family protein [Candidatus Neomarinimicrobiota bacterium]
MKDVTIGIDLGGTKVSIGLVSNYEVLNEPERFLIAECQNADALVSHIKKSLQKIIEESGLRWSDISHIGIGSPGPLDYKTGIILETPNLIMVRNYPLGPKLEEAIGIKTFVNNDANCFTLGEQKAGVAKNMDYVLGVTLGTGFGLGFVYNGKIFNGATGTALEFALTPYKDGVFEDYISGRGISRIYKNLSGEQVEPIEVSKLAEKSDATALEAWCEFGQHFAQALICLVNVLDPDIIVIGGSVVKGFRFFRDTLIKDLLSGIHEGPRNNIKVEPSKLGELAAIIGASSLS